MAISTIKSVQNDFNQWVDISSYTESNPYVCPSDGYVFVYNASGQSGYVTIWGKDNPYGGISCGVPSGRISTFVRRGMRVFSSGTSSAKRFMPLV